MKAFGWARSAIAGNDEATTAVLAAIREFSEAAKLDMVVGSGDQSQRAIAQIQPSEFRAAVDEPNKLDAGLGGAHVRSRGGEISIVIDWTRATNAPRTTITTTIQEHWFDAHERVSLLTKYLGDVARGAGLEYQVASHISDEVSKLEAAPVPGARYEARPGAGIPYVPWWLALGPAYVSAVDQAALRRLGPEILSWVDGFALLRTTDSPLLYGTAEAKTGEARVRDALGEGVFLGSASSQGPTYPVGYTVAPPHTGEIWDAYARDGKVTVVPRNQA